MYPQLRPRCPGFSPDPLPPRPCGAPLRFNASLCESCMHKQKQHEAGIMLWASLGVRELEQYLSGWAAFRDYEQHHPPV